ncbi:MAG: exopolyphosphatase [Saprospiraceae bacterium]|nr:exopolyphosphatase [Saprospiraceae bacterium]
MLSAVIDLGTNTFHLLIVRRLPAGAWAPVLRERIFVKLAEEGIERIGPAAFARGLAALAGFRQHLDAAGVPPEQVWAYGTAALRTAANAGDFFAAVLAQTGIRAEAISGEREAGLIYQGVRQAVPFSSERMLVMDIGGGSVEMVLADREQIFWQKSFPVGVAVLFRQFHKSDPIAPAEVAAVESFLDEQLAELWAALARLPAQSLVGAAGAFDIIDRLLLDPATKPLLYGLIPAAHFLPLCDRVLASTLAEREQWQDLAPERREMIVVGMILIRRVLNGGHLKQIFTSEYSMKEGMLAEILAAQA